MPMNEILTVLADEIDAARAPMEAALADFASATGHAGRTLAVELYLEEVRRIGSAAEALGLEGVAGLYAVCERNFQALLARPHVTPEVQALSKRWPQLLRDYLRAPRSVDTAHALAFLFTDPNCPAPIDADSAEALQAILLDVSLERIAEQMAEDSPKRASEATLEDVALDIPADVNPALVEAFLAEGPLQAAHYSATLQRVIQGEVGVDALNEARRVVHAVKGAANTVGVRGVANLTHHLEDILETMGNNSLRPEGALARLLMQAADCLEMMFETLIEAKNPPPQALSVLQQILACANRMDRGEFDFAPLASDTVTPFPAAPSLSDETAPAAAAVPLTPKLRVAASTIDGMLRQSGEMTISRAHIQERLNQAFLVGVGVAMLACGSIVLNRLVKIDF